MNIRTMILMALAALFLAGNAIAEDSRELNRIAKIYQSGNVEKAVPELKSYLSVHSDDTLAWTILGHASKDAGQLEEAEKAYKEAIRLNPKRVEAITGMGMLARISKDYDAAMRWYEQAIKIDPKYGQAYSSIVTIALKKSDFKKAVSVGEKGYQLDNTDPVIAANLAIAYHYDKQIEARDKMTKTAERLGYGKLDVLQKIYAGELDVRD
jgi:tetratricopeptide (TPR) repeat protein